MGNKQNEEVDNPNFNMAAYNQRVQQAAVYQQHATLNPNMAQFHMAEHKKKFEIEQTQKRKVETLFSFFKKSLKITTPSDNLLDIKFHYIAKTGGEITIFLLAQQIEDTTTNMTVDVVAEVKYSQQAQVNSAEVEFVAQIPLNRSVGGMGFERRPAYSCYPILIRFTSPEQNLYVYLKPQANFSRIHLIKQKIEKDGRGYFFEEIYGLNKSDEERMCIVCYSLPSSVTIYPCRHMCLCKECCELLKEKSQKCPICRGNIESFMQVNAKS